MVMNIQWNAGATRVRIYDKEDDVKVESARYEDDYLFIGKSLRFTGESEDLVFLGESLEFTGKTKLGVIALGKTVSIGGEPENGIISAAKDIIIDSKVKGTNYLAGKKIQTSKNSEIIGDVFTGCAELILDGNMTGDVYAGAGKIVINGEINGNVKIYGGRLIISDSGKINGDLYYSTKEKLTVSELSRISGKTEFKKVDKDKGFPFIKKPNLVNISFLFKLFLLVSFIVVGSIILFIPGFKYLQEERTSKSFWYTALWGLIPMFMYPAVIVLCIILVIPIPLAGILLLSMLPLFFITKIIGATLLGQYLSNQFKWDIQKRHYHFLIGAGLFSILSLLPFLGFLTAIFLSSIGWGIIISFLFNIQLKYEK